MIKMQINANRLRLVALAALVVIVAVVIVAVLWPHSSAKADRPTHQSPTAIATTGRSAPGHKSTPSPRPSSTTTPPSGVITNPKKVLHATYPPSVTATVRQEVVATKPPAAVMTKLRKFLRAYYTLKPGANEAIRAAHIKSLVSRRALPLDLSISELPAGTTSTVDQIVESQLLAQLDPQNSRQMLVTVPVKESLRAQGIVYFQTINTGTTFQYSASSGWSIVHFSEALAEEG